jgi:hypothetical protein
VSEGVAHPRRPLPLLTPFPPCSGNICAYVTVAAGFSILLSVFLFTWQAVRWYQRRQTRPGPLSAVDATLCALAGVWWIPAAVVATINGQRADDDGLEEHTARTAVWGLSWAALGLFCILTLVQLAGRALESPKPRPGPIQMAAPPATSPAVYAASPSPTHISGRPVPASPFLSYSPVYAPPPYPPPQYSAEPFVPIPMATEPPPFRPAP